MNLKRKPNGGKYGKSTALSYEGVLDQIADYLCSIEQWKNKECYDNACKYFHKAEALIELLEDHNCGSVGGFDKDQPITCSLLDRYEWLTKKIPKELE